MYRTFELNAAASIARRPHLAKRFPLLLAMAALLLTALASRVADAAPFVHKNVNATKVFRNPVNLVAGTTYTFETSGLSPTSCDPMMYLFRYSDYNSGGAQVWDNISTTNLNARIRITPTASTAGQYDVVVRGKTAGCSGTVTMNGTVLGGGSQPFGGTLITLTSAVPASPTWVEYQTAAIRNGSPDTRMWGLTSATATGKVVAYSDEEGVGHMSRFQSQTTRAVLVSSYSSGLAGVTDLYINPINDQVIYDSDDDGLADLTEQEIGLCDQMPCSTTSFAASDAADTDHDGLYDNEEIFGRDDPTKVNPQMLALWGANPKHKDIFVEWDWLNAFPSNPFRTTDADAVASWFADAPVGDVMNPDGLPGVNIHIDIGIANASGSTTYGNWGGSGPAVPSAILWQSWQNPANFNPLRVGIFRHAMLNNGNSGAARVNYREITWPGNMADRGVGLFVHELGHSIGLEHHGHNSWGSGNCKPTYVSTMNYLFIGRLFSRGSLNYAPLNPASVLEAKPFGESMPSHLAQPPLSYSVIGTNVNWNRDNTFEAINGRVRAPLRWSPGGAAGGGCDPFISNSTRFLSGNDRYGRETPSLVKYNNRLYAFYLNNDRLAYRSAPIGGPDVNGSWCTTTNCAVWSAESIMSTPGYVAGSVGVIGQTVATWGNGLYVAYRLVNGEVRWQSTNAPGPNGTLPNWTNQTTIGVMDATPHLSVMYVNPAFFANSTEAMMLHGSVAQKYRQWTLVTNLGGVFASYNIKDTTGHEIDGSVSPTVVSWPSRGGANHADVGTSCAVFVDRLQAARFYCYVKSSDRWQDFSAKMYQWIPMAHTPTKVGLAYHVLRNGTGGALGNDITRGQFWMTVAPGSDTNGDGVIDPAPSKPELYISTYLSASNPPHPNITQWSVKGPYWDATQTVDTYTNVGLYEDESISAMKGTWFENNTSILFMPYADGTFNEPLKDGNDFQVMERGICMGVLGGEDYLAQTTCGTSNFFGY